MKKFTRMLSLVVALCVMVAIGGVYATWNYSENFVNTENEQMSAGMQDYIGNSSAGGNIKVIEKTVGISVVDNKNGNTVVGENEAGDHIAEIEMTGHVAILFTPFNNASDDVKANGITIQYTLGQTGFAQYNGSDIFTVNTNAITCNTMTKITAENLATINATLGAGNQLSVTDIGKFYVEIPASDWVDDITFTNTVTLDTLIKYHDFQEALAQGNFEITISEKE